MWLKIYIYIFRKSTIYPHPLCSCFLLCPLFAISPPTAGGGEGTRYITKVRLFVCACWCPEVSQTPYGPLYLISPICYQDRYCLHQGEKSLPPFVSLSLPVCPPPPHLFYTQTACTDVPLSQNKECPLQRHLSVHGVSGIIHSAVTDDGAEQGQLGLLCHVKPSRAFGATLFSPLILHHQSKNTPMDLTSSSPWPLNFI